ncbi:MAG: DNA alkylation repair protein [Opitutales bacterium]|nr:DNA alkylation repair protein [Opitutales bacterium]
MPPLGSEALIQLDHALKAAADPAHRATVRDHFGSNVERFYGARIPRIRQITESSVPGRELSLAQRWKYCDELAATGTFEHKIAAFHLASLARREWTGTEMPRFARWLHRSVDDWMDTDDLCIRVIGEFFLRFPEQAAASFEWSKMPGTWSRRGAAVALIPSARKGGLWDLAHAVCNKLMNDPEPLVAKACGWLLKVSSRPHPERVRQFVEQAGNRMSPLVRRIATEKLCAP